MSENQASFYAGTSWLAATRAQEVTLSCDVVGWAARHFPAGSCCKVTASPSDRSALFRTLLRREGSQRSERTRQHRTAVHNDARKRRRHTRKPTCVQWTP